LPLVLYRSPVRLLGKFDPAAVFEELFERNGWGDSWRNGIYDYAHYHSRIHEVLGVARGHARVRFGGAKGRALKLKAADVVISCRQARAMSDSQGARTCQKDSSPNNFRL
jgi:uncharacterized protein YjlB